MSSKPAKPPQKAPPQADQVAPMVAPMATPMAAPESSAPGPEIGDIEAWVFDLDNTLYPASCNLFAQVSDRIRDYVARFLNLPPDEAYDIQKAYFRAYGTTMNGMMLNHAMDPGPFLDHVHDIDISDVRPSPELHRALGEIKGRKFIFTNASTAHADNVMKQLGVRDHFDDIIDIVATGYKPKPDPAAYRTLIDRLDINPSRAIMIDDMTVNLEPAAALGMTTLWVRTDLGFGHDNADGNHIDHITDDLLDWLKAYLAAPAPTTQPLPTGP